MRRLAVCALMISLLLLAGCQKREDQLQEGFARFRQALQQEEGTVTAQAELTADYGESCQTYVLAVEHQDGQTRLELLEPEELAGAGAVVDEEGAQLTWEGTVLAAPPVDEEGLTPVSALPAILKAARQGYIQLLWEEDGYLAARLELSGQSVVTLWLDPQSLAPRWAEISSAGRTVIHCTFTQWETT